MSNLIGAWKFSSDGSFNSSTTMFGGMSSWGNWEIISPGKIKITYTRTTEGIIPDESIKINQCCIVNDCSLFIDSHLTVVKSNNGKPKFRPYLQRLQNLAEITRVPMGGSKHF
jgi:hypothetical protein